MFLEFTGEFRRAAVALAEHNKGLHDMAAHCVRASHNCGLDYCVMFNQRALDFEWANAIAGADDQIVSASHKPVVPVVILVSFVAGQVPGPETSGRSEARLLPISEEQRWRRSLERDLSFF